MMNEASDWLIEYKLARRGCRIKMGAEYYIDRLSGLEDKEIIEKFKNTLKRNGRISTDIRKAISEFDKWISIANTKGTPGEVISKELSIFLSYNYSYFTDISNLSRHCLQQLLRLKKYFQNNFSELPTDSRDKRVIAFFLQMNLKKFESLDWLVHLIFYFEKNNKKDKISFSPSERDLLLTFSRIIKNESNYNKGILCNPGHLITKEHFKIISLPCDMNNYLKRYTKKGILKKRRSRKGLNEEGYTFDQRPIDVFMFLSKNLDNLLSIFKKLSSSQKSFRLSKNTEQMLSTIKRKKANIIRLSTSFLSIEGFSS